MFYIVGVNFKGWYGNKKCADNFSVIWGTCCGGPKHQNTKIRDKNTQKKGIILEMTNLTERKQYKFQNRCVKSEQQIWQLSTKHKKYSF